MTKKISGNFRIIHDFNDLEYLRRTLAFYREGLARQGIYFLEDLKRMSKEEVYRARVRAVLYQTGRMAEFEARANFLK